MSGKRSKNERYEYALKLLFECEDYATGTDFGRRCRERRRELEEKGSQVRLSDEQMELLETLKQALRNKHMSTADICLTQMDFHESHPQQRGTRGIIMSIFEKIGKIFSGKDNKPDVIETEAEKEEKKIRDLQKMLASIVDKHAVQMKKMMQIAMDCSKMDPDSMEYRMKRQEALILVPQVKAYEQSINQYSKVLENASKYSSMLQTGMATAALKSFLPDLARAETILSMISDETENIADNAREFEKEYERYSKVVDSSSDLHAFEDDALFEEMLKKAQTEQKAATALQASAQKAAVLTTPASVPDRPSAVPAPSSPEEVPDEIADEVLPEGSIGEETT